MSTVGCPCSLINIWVPDYKGCIPCIFVIEAYYNLDILRCLWPMYVFELCLLLANNSRCERCSYEWTPWRHLLQWCWTMCLNYKHCSWFKCLLQILIGSDHLLKNLETISAFAIQRQLYKLRWQSLWFTFVYHTSQFPNKPVNQT